MLNNRQEIASKTLNKPCGLTATPGLTPWLKRGGCASVLLRFNEREVARLLVRIASLEGLKTQTLKEGEFMTRRRLLPLALLAWLGSGLLSDATPH